MSARTKTTPATRPPKAPTRPTSQPPPLAAAPDRPLDIEERLLRIEQLSALLLMLAGSQAEGSDQCLSQANHSAAWCAIERQAVDMLTHVRAIGRALPSAVHSMPAPSVDDDQ